MRPARCTPELCRCSAAVMPIPVSNHHAVAPKVQDPGDTETDMVRVRDVQSPRGAEGHLAHNTFHVILDDLDPPLLEKPKPQPCLASRMQWRCSLS